MNVFQIITQIILTVFSKPLFDGSQLPEIPTPGESVELLWPMGVIALTCKWLYTIMLTYNSILKKQVNNFH